jgi:hypothetical protein
VYVWTWGTVADQSFTLDVVNPVLGCLNLAHRDMLRRRMMVVANEAKRTSQCRIYAHAP